MLYYCVGFTISSTCAREHAVVFATLAPDAEVKLMALLKSRAKVAEAVNRSWNRPFAGIHSTLIPGIVVPTVVGTILDAEEGTKSQFFDAVTQLFSPEGDLPKEKFLYPEQVRYFPSLIFGITPGFIG